MPCDRKRNAKWRREHAIVNKERTAKWKREHPEEVRASAAKWARANAAAVNAKNNRYDTRKTAAGGSYTAAEWKCLIEHYGNKCLCCGRTDVKLTADHIIPISKGGASNIENIQPLCGPCNSGKCDRTIDYRPDSGLSRWIQRKLFG